MTQGKKFKHRLVVDITLAKPGSERDAAKQLWIILQEADSGINGWSAFGVSTIHRPKEFSRVFRAELQAQIRNTPEYLGDT